MSQVNRVILQGNLTREPDMRYTAAGTAVCNLGIAVNHKYNDSQGNTKEDTCFTDVEVWGKHAENCSKYLSKGRPVLVDGRLKMDSWEDKNTGQRRNKLSVKAENLQFLGGSESSGGTGRKENGTPFDKS